MSEHNDNNDFEDLAGKASPGLEAESTEPRSQASVLMGLIEGRKHTLFQDQYGVACIRVTVKNHDEVMFLQSDKFKHFLGRLYYLSTGRVVCQEVTNDVVRLLAAKAMFDSPSHDLHLRAAWTKNRAEIHYDLTDSLWRCIAVTKDSWDIIPHQPECMFTRFNQKPQIEPDRNYPEDIFDQFLDLMHINDHGRRILTKVWVISAFIPNFPHPIDMTHGEKGSLKSTLCRYKKEIIDPDRIKLLTIPKDKSEFVQQLYHNYLAVYENVRYIPPWFSDEVCRAVTGAGSTKRGLYTNDEDVIYDYKRILIINGINNMLTEPDALDRCVLSDYDRLTPKQRRTESDVDREFEQMKPKLLGYIFDILVKVIRTKSDIELKDLPRMADFAAWGETISRAIGYKPLEFMNSYYDNIGKQHVEAIEASPLGHAMTKLVDKLYKEGQQSCYWQGSTTQLVTTLNDIATIENMNTNSRSWPQSANSLSKKLKPLASNLREGMGIEIDIYRITHGARKNTSTARVRKVSPLPPPSPPDDNQARNEGENGGGSFDGGDTTSTEDYQPPPNNTQNRAQDGESGGSGDGGGYFRILGGDASSSKYVLVDDKPPPRPQMTDSNE